MFKVGHQVKVANGMTGTVTLTEGFSVAYVSLGTLGTLKFKQGDLYPTHCPEGWTPAVAGSLKVGDEVMTYDGLVTTVTGTYGRAWVFGQTKPKNLHVNSLRVRIPGAVVAGDYDACTAVVPDATWAAVWKAWVAKFQVTHTLAVKNYTSNWYSEVNSALRAGHPISAVKYGDRLDAALAMGRTDRSMILWRSGSSKFDKAMPVGSEFVDLGFGSCTISKSVALNWGSNGKVLFEIRCLADTVGGYVRSVSAHPQENEFVLPRNARYRVAGRREEHGRVVFVVDLVGQG